MGKVFTSGRYYALVIILLFLILSVIGSMVPQTDASNEASTPTPIPGNPLRNNRTDQFVSYILTLTAGWNMITPGVQSSLTARQIFGTNMQNCFEWDALNQTYKDYRDNALNQGMGYWLRVISPATVTMSGSAASDIFWNSMNNSWNLLGNPFEVETPWTNISIYHWPEGWKTLDEARLAGWVGSIYRWEAGQYVTPDLTNLLYYGQAFWLHCTFSDNNTIAIAYARMSTAYQPLSAVLHAEQYALSFDPWYYVMPASPPWGGSYDCTNFVSQALLAGQWPMALGPYDQLWCWWYNNSDTGPYQGSDDTWSHTWTIAPDLFSFSTQYSSPRRAFCQSIYQPSATMPNYSTGGPGNIYFYDWTNDGEINHASIYATDGVDRLHPEYSGSLVDAHSDSRLHAIWYLKPYNPQWLTTSIYAIRIYAYF